MRMTKKLLIWIIASVIMLGPLTLSVYADKVEIESVFTYGETLDNNQFEQTKRMLGVEEGTKEVPVYVNELNDLLNDTYPYNQVYSSAYITPARNDGQITVEILTPDTITSITPLQYQNAAITAGAIDINIAVASAVKVDGSGALAGVYKAFQDQGIALNDQAITVAQEELQVVSDINNQHQDSAGYDPELLNGAITEIKNEIQTLKEENNGSITADQINSITNTVINNYNLQNILTEENINNIYQLSGQFNQLNFTAEQRQQLQNLGDQILSDGGDLFKEAKTNLENLDISLSLDEETKNWFQSTWDSITTSVSDFFAGIKEWFENLSK